eukprot:TRINITY_DN25423_c0_g1_i1.p1 TRINITY_DN25423_c0_g1~~TRINITY_DN25423_c0_g1_i1.p1  ORF type:complete len:167 (-),score=34.29 TRINITY_DN25423_c0_g1_i1:357-857(-)
MCRTWLLAAALCLQVGAEYLEPRDISEAGWENVVWFKDCVPMDKRMESANIFQNLNFRMQIVQCLRGCELPKGGCESMTQGCGDDDGCVPKKGQSCECLDCIMWCFKYGAYGDGCMNDYQIELCKEYRKLNECRKTDCNSAVGAGPSRLALLAIGVFATLTLRPVH